MPDLVPDDRRSGSPPRMPFVRRCRLGFADGRLVTAFLVNISAAGAYLTRDDFAPRPDGTPERDAAAGSGLGQDELPRMGEVVSCRFTLPGSETEIVLTGTVSWLNPRQHHPVHSLPPGFGLGFDAVGPVDRGRLEAMVSEYLARARR